MELTTFYKEMHDEKIMFTFKGEASYGLMDALLGSIEPRIVSCEKDVRVRKRLYSVLVECLQNMVHHGESTNEDQSNDGKVTLLMVTSEKENYRVYTGNSISNSKISELREWLDVINLLSPKELRNSYKKILDKGAFSDKGTAGLGFIDIARKSGEKLNYDFHRINDQFSIFSFSIRISRQFTATG